MPTTLTESSTFTSSITVADNGDPADAGSGGYIREPFQGLTNRTKYLKDVLDSGVKKIQKATTVSAMTGATGMAGGDLVLLANVSNLGLFMYVAGATVGTNITGWRYDSTTEAGYWIRLDWPLYNDGVQVVRQVASLAALKALTGMKNGHLAIYHNGNFPRLYHFVETGSPPSTVTDFAYPADDSTGFWASELWWLVDNAFTFGALTADDTTINGNLSVSTDAHVQGDATIDGAATATSLALNGALDSGKKLSVTGNAKITGTLEVTGSVTLSGTTIAKGKFRRRTVTLTNTDATVSIDSGDTFYCPSGVLTTDRTLTITTSSAVDGDVIRVATVDTSYFVTADWSTGTMPLKNDSAQRRWVELTYIGSVWVVTGLGDKVT